ncbi:hypothetical protein [Pseudoprimorskyibacter insulae]|uniref:DUF2802 domain-containing protein n=1 Tax=Pseudoprimorskyibacter insulae TaxID=1695997 RepID=A0A2R8AVK2_9RHOB|nr:hypothetical protein [Pseudoprimorskyibacter insulae]SPF80062.1 hypothetical protein PRI8871_01864 [Pseudoprimorskyibacter insulae]
MTYLPYLHLGAAAGLVLALAVIVAQTIALRKAAKVQPQPALGDDVIDAIADRVMGKLISSPEVGLADFKADLSRMRADLDWFVGDKLIEQAIAMAKQGETETEISQATGISLDEVHAIRRMRRH